MFYGFVAIISVALLYAYRQQLKPHMYLLYGFGGLFVMGLGIGPSMSGFTVVVQNSAPANQLGVATSTLTFLRQIGGGMGIAMTVER